MDFSSITTPLEADLMVAFGDINGFAAIASRMSRPLDAFAFLQGWAEVCFAAVEGGGGGRIIKFIGDSFLAVFGPEGVDDGVRALLEAKRASEEYFQQKGFGSRLRVTAHFGTVAIGPYGAEGRKQLDVGGDSVNIAAALGHGEHRGSMVISPQAFRRLSAETRKLFHKHTPPVVYLA
jgi:class 3 adenylate cyclase